MRKKFLVGLTAGLFMFGMVGIVNATSIAYLRSNTGLPWNESNNESAMDGVFGAGNWDDLRYETVDTNALFSNDTNFIFMEGGDQTANELESFLTSNQATYENWVSSGGHLFINSAPNEGDGMAFGFGDIQLNYSDYADAVTGVDPNHVIFNGPYGNTGNIFTGGYFAHATISGAGLTSLITNDANNNNVLAEMSFGDGYVMFGGMTTLNFQNPNSFILRENILSYASDGAGIAPVPEPATMLLLGTGLAGLIGSRIRRKKKA